MKHFIWWIVFGVVSSGLAAPAPASSPWSDFVGTYRYRHGQTIELVAGDELFAVLDGGKYPLRPAGGDVFINAVGIRVPFRRNAAGEVIGFEESGTFYPRLADSVSVEAAALAYPRPAGERSPLDYHYDPPADLHDGIPVGDISRSDLGLGSATRIVDGILDGTYKDVHSVLLYQRGRLVLEEYFYGYNVGRTHQLRSATKSIVSALAGIAIDRGALNGVKERVLPRMHYDTYANPDPRKSQITLGDFLCMSSGLDCNDYSSSSPGRETAIYETPDWVKATLDLPMVHDPGTKAYYCSGGVGVVGRMIENAVSMSLPDFAQERLFGPLGMRRADWTWNYDLTNADREFAQIHLRPRDMLKLGLLFADGGRWHGREVLSASWVKASLAEHSQIDNTSYGYFWWRPWLNVKTPSGNQRVDLIAAQGNGGQKIYLVPQHELVAVFTGGDYNSGAAPPNRIMVDIILPTLIGNFGVGPR